MDESTLFIALLFFACGAAAAIFGYSFYIQKKIGSLEHFSEQKKEELIKKAKEEAETLSWQMVQETEKRTLDSRQKLEKEEARLRDREDRLDARLSQFEKRGQELEKKESQLNAQLKKCDEKAIVLAQKERDLELALAQSINLTPQEAENRLFEILSQKNRELFERRIREKEARLKEEGDCLSAIILATACLKNAAKTASTASTLEIILPSPEMRGRIIGREGKNIQHFEQKSGTTLLVEDRENRVLISGFDPLRRQIAHEALKLLIQDGRIHPTAIDQALESAKNSVHSNMRKKAEEAIHTLGLSGVHPAIKELLGLCSLKNSLGQNILEHLIEVARLMGALAAELSLDIQIAKRMGLLHDIGKVATHMEGPHDTVGAELARKYGENEKVVNAIASHHGRETPTSAEAILLKSADTLSAARPGARSEIAEKIASRQEILERIALQIDGVERAYSLKAGRELQLFIDGKKIQEKDYIAFGENVRKELGRQGELSGPLKIILLSEKKAVEL